MKLTSTSPSQDSLPGGGRNQPFYKVISEHNWDAYEAQSDIQPIKVAARSSQEEAVAVLQKIRTMFEIRVWGKAFNTLRIEPWDGEKKGTESGVGKTRKKKATKAKRRAEKGKKDERGKQTEEEEEQQQQKAGGRAKGQVYLVPNAWMREAWPHD